MAGVRLFAFNLGTEIVDMANFDPLGPEVGTKVHTPYFAYLIEHQRGYVLFDTGAHSRFITEEGSAPPTTGPRIIMRGHEHVVARLESLGIAPADVGHVVLSHLHIDHAGGLESFPDALTYVQRRELEFAHWPPVYQRPFYVPGDFAGPRAWSELSGTFDLFGDERLILFSTPGHSAGHQSMLVRLPGRPVILVGDAAYSPRNLEQRVLPAIVWSPDATVESWDKIERWRDRHDALLIFTHDLMWRTGTRLGPAEWYE
jgi:glyoxylase-like metal-dependent hydrolase (beta-lactamase superfamily II)